MKPFTDQRHDKQQKSMFIGLSGNNCTLKITVWIVRRVNDKKAFINQCMNEIKMCSVFVKLKSKETRKW